MGKKNSRKPARSGEKHKFVSKSPRAGAIKRAKFDVVQKPQQPLAAIAASTSQAPKGGEVTNCNNNRQRKNATKITLDLDKTTKDGIQSNNANLHAVTMTRSRSKARGQSSADPKVKVTDNVQPGPSGIKRTKTKVNKTRGQSPEPDFDQFDENQGAHSDDDGVQVSVHDSEDQFSGDSEMYDTENETTDDDQTSSMDGSPQPKLIGDKQQQKKDWIKEIKNNPEVKGIIQQLVEDEIDQRERRKTNTPESARKSTNVKSPSDTTLYTPALKRGYKADNTIQKISNFVESLRLSSVGRDSRERSGEQDRPQARRQSPSPPKDRSPSPDVVRVRRSRSHSRSRSRRRSRSRSRSMSRRRSRGRSRDRRHRRADRDHSSADRLVVEAERFRANIAPPKGRYTQSELVQLRKEDGDDDDFFHVTCHIDQNLKDKIEMGEFIELEKLLPKDKFGVNSMYKDETELKFFSRNGETYFGPANDTARINGIRKWDQAFRVYAAIYTNANPERSTEIWQYIHVINVAATSFPWDNVAYYDFTFRQLMAQKPWRSWAKTYTQGWNIALRGNLGNPNTHHGSQKPGTSGTSKSVSHDWRDDCCWRFSRNNKCPKGSSCRYDHKCTYCGGTNHGYNSCRKRKNKEGTKSKDTKSSESSASLPK